MSNPVCMLHTYRFATALCTECSRPICQECTQTVAGKPVCQNCLTAIRSRVAVQLNAETAAPQPPPPTASQPSNPPYTQPGGYDPTVQLPPMPQYGAPAAGQPSNTYNPPPGSQYPPPQPPYGAQPTSAYPPQQPQQQPYPPQAPYGVPQQGYGAPAQQPYGQQGQSLPQPAPGQQPAYNPYGAAQEPYPAQQQQPGYPNPGQQAPYGTHPQQYPGHNPYGVQQPRPLAAPQPVTSAGNYILGVVLGLIAAIVGAGIYIWIISTTHMMIGYMALGIGFGIGWAVKIGARMPSAGAGIVAAVLTVLAILPGQILFYRDGSDILFTALFLFIGCRWAYSIAAGRR